MPCFGQELNWSHWYTGSAPLSAPSDAPTLTLSFSCLRRIMRDPTPNAFPFIMAWYVAYPISSRQVEEMRQERGVAVDHSPLNRWVIKYAPQWEKQFRRRHCPVGRSWRREETYVRIKGDGPPYIAP